MSETTHKSGSWRVFHFPLLLLFATLLTAGVTFAGLPLGNTPGLIAQESIISQGTPTPTPITTATATIACTSAGTPGPWTARANYPQSYAYMGVTSDGANVYSFGGHDWGGPFGVGYKYTYSTNTWTPLATSPSDGFAWARAEYGNNGRIYVFGGGSSNWNITRIYDIASNSWSTGAPVPTTGYVSHYASAYWDGKVYVIGGYGLTNAVYAYDIATDSWSTLAPLPQAEEDMASAAINGKIYVANGQTSGGIRTNALYIYDIATNTWSEGPPSPLASTLQGSTVIGGKLYMIGGDATGSPYSSNTYLYDPATNNWSAGPSLSVGRTGGGAATINTPGGQTAIVVGGFGSNYWMNSVEASMEPLVPCTTTPTGIPQTNTPTRTNTSVPPSTTGTTNVTPTSTRAAPSNTVAPPSSTAPAPPTNTVAATPTPCTISFTDVPPGSTFYPYIRCLACRGIVSGYSDGTFLPNNLVTRGQLSKIVSGAAGFAEDPGPQMFEDVPGGHPFYLWINRLARRGIMGGYNCGGPNEPCIGGLPYFRPANSATRGQTSKIVAGAAYITQEPSGQTFEDVPPEHTFYRWIEQLASRGVMGGYGCGEPGEPCLPPLDRPYFRPNNSVTRGQAAKIVANTFYPACVTPGR